SSELLFRSDVGHSRAWLSLKEAPWGPGILEYRVDDEARFRARIVCISAGRIFLSGIDGEGKVDLEGFGADRVGVVPVDGLVSEIVSNDVYATVAQEEGAPASDDVTISLRPENPRARPPRRVTVEMTWGEKNRVDFDVPYPGRYAVFVRGDGEPLPEDAEVAVDDLAMLAVEAVSLRGGDSYFLETALWGHDVSGDHKSAAFGKEKLIKVDGEGLTVRRLGFLQAAVERALASSRDVSAKVVIRLIPQGIVHGASQGLQLRRFYSGLKKGHEGSVFVSEASLEGIDPTTVRLEAIALWDASLRVDFPLAESSSPDGGLSWHVAPALREPGPWLLLAWQGLSLRFRPLLWHVEGDAPTAAVAERSSPPGTLQAISLIKDNNRRQIVLSDLVAALAKDLSHPEWRVVYGFLDKTSHLPPAIFDLLGVLVSQPEAVALALLRAARSETFHHRLDVFEELWVFIPCLPVSAWLSAGDQIKRLLEVTIAGDADRVRDLLARQLDTFLTEGQARYSGLGAIGERLREHLGMAAPPQRTLRLFDEGTGFDLLKAHAHALRDELRREYKDADSWPTWEGLDPLRETICCSRPQFRSLFEHEETWWQQGPVFEAPLVAAIVAASSHPLAPAERLAIQRLADFAPKYFDEIHGLALAGAMTLLTQAARGAPR
ncbi:MAG: STY4851/ECs_5259 family protein, partial [Deltaproteobacteria bacterium]|nr:STY4851/ECs_5259 family protein [Deltaproteobacteria bacterium]